MLEIAFILVIEFTFIVFTYWTGLHIHDAVIKAGVSGNILQRGVYELPPAGASRTRSVFLPNHLAFSFFLMLFNYKDKNWTFILTNTSCRLYFKELSYTFGAILKNMK